MLERFLVQKPSSGCRSKVRVRRSWWGRIVSFELYLPVERVDGVQVGGGDASAIYHLADGPTNGPDKSEKSGDTAEIKKK